MKKDKIKHKNFIDTYEKDIKKYREEYYKKITTNSNKTCQPIILFYIIPIIVAIIILAISKYSITGYIIALLTTILINYITKIISKVLKLESSNEYLANIKKIGFLSIDEYEKKLKKYVTGPNGYYQLLLNDIINKYQINNNTKKISETSGEEYYIWTNQNKEKIILLNSRPNKKPEVTIIPISNIRYFRIDNISNCIVLNTSTNLYFFKKESLSIFNEIIKEKRLENIKTNNSETYISDYEIYMHSIKSEEAKIIQEKNNQLTLHINKILITLIILVIILILTYFIKKYKVLFNIVGTILICYVSTELRNALSINIPKFKNDKQYIKELNSNPECISRFKELKYVLGISEDYDRVYTIEGTEYQAWLANGYFHIFLNIIYFNVVYMVVKLTDVVYYKREDNECIVKLKDKTLCFAKEAENTFRKILPNKDYNWLKGFPKK